MRLLAIITLIIFVAAGIVLGALNAGMVDYDFGFAQVQLPKGAALLGALVIGWLLGGVTAWLGSGPRRSRDVSRAGRKPPVAP
jgi:uncharacterized integral membrane protein